MITAYYQTLEDGQFNIPDKVIISLPADEIEYDKYRKSCIRNYSLEVQRAKLGDSPQCYKSDAGFEHPSPPDEDEIPTVLFLKPLGTYNYQKIKKRSTTSNNYLKRLNFSTRRVCEVTEVELVNEGWEIIRVIPLDIYSSFFIPDLVQDNIDSGSGIFIQVNHPSLSREVEKLGYSSDNLCFMICVTPDFFLNYLSIIYPGTNNLLFGNVRGNIRFTNISVNDYFEVDQSTLTFACDFISEESYQRYKNSRYKLAVGLGNSNNFLKVTDKYIPGHLYKFLCTKKTINVGDRRSNSFFLLYIGKIGLSSYISSTAYDKHSTLFCNNFIDMFDAAEFNEWTDDRGKISKFGKGDLSNCRLWGELNIPVDVFIPINHGNRGRSACKGRLIKNILAQGKPYTEEEFYNHEGEVFKLAGKARELSFNSNEERVGEFDIHEVPSDYFPKGINVDTLDELDYLIGEELVPRFVVLPSVDLISSKKKNILEACIEEKSNLDCKKIDSGSEAEYKTSYKHFMDILDAGEYVSFKSPAKSIMKNLLLRAEGEITNYSYYAIRQKYRGYYDTNSALWRVVGIDSYDLFSEEELSKLDDRVLENLKNNLSNLILADLLIYGIKYLEYKIIGHSYLSSFSESSFMPEFEQVTGLLKEIEEEVFKCYNQSKSDKPTNTGSSISIWKFITPGSKYSLLRGELLDPIIGVLMNGNSRERKYRKGGIDHIIKKYKLTTEDFKKCELYRK